MAFESLKKQDKDYLHEAFKEIANGCYYITRISQIYDKKDKNLIFKIEGNIKVILKKIKKLKGE